MIGRHHHLTNFCKEQEQRIRNEEASSENRFGELDREKKMENTKVQSNDLVSHTVEPLTIRTALRQVSRPKRASNRKNNGEWRARILSTLHDSRVLLHDDLSSPGVRRQSPTPSHVHRDMILCEILEEALSISEEIDFEK